jgi:hypothetical protein
MDDAHGGIDRKGRRYGQGVDAWTSTQIPSLQLKGETIPSMDPHGMFRPAQHVMPDKQTRSFPPDSSFWHCRGNYAKCVIGLIWLGRSVVVEALESLLARHHHWRP